MRVATRVAARTGDRVGEIARTAAVRDGDVRRRRQDRGLADLARAAAGPTAWFAGVATPRSRAHGEIESTRSRTADGCGCAAAISGS
jgi:hypothetical protein